MRIGLLTQWFEPEPGPAALPGMLASGLAERGHDVRVVTGFPNYPEGRVFDGYRQRRRQDESRNGVLTRRVALYPSHDASRLGRLVNYGSFAVSAAASGLDVLRDVDALWVNYSPVTVGVPMFAQRWRRHTPTVVHALDLWPDTLFASGAAGEGSMGRVARSILGRWCGAMYRQARSVAYISPGVGELLLRRGVPPEKLRYAPMWADESLFFPVDPPDRRSWQLGLDTVTLGYAGTLGNAQDLTTLIRACASVTELDFRCLIAGSGTEESRLRNLADELGATNVTFLGRLGRDEVGHLVACSDIQYVGLNDHPLARTTMPSKVQAVLASGRPVIGSLVGDAASVVARAGGRPVPPGDVAGLTAELRAAVASGRRGLAEAGRRARNLYEQEFAMAVGIGRIEQLLCEAAHA